MSLLEQVKTQQLSLRLLRSEEARWKASALTVVLGEVERLNKSYIDDTKVLSLIKKTLTGVQESLEYSAYLSIQYMQLMAQKEVLESFIPKQMAYEEVVEIIKSYKANMPQLSLGDVQKHFKLTYLGCYQGSDVTRAFKEG